MIETLLLFFFKFICYNDIIQLIGAEINAGIPAMARDLRFFFCVLMPEVRNGLFVEIWCELDIAARNLYSGVVGTSCLYLALETGKTAGSGAGRHHAGLLLALYEFGV
jgi:hypothetical protein